MSFIAEFESSTGRVTKINPSASDKLEFPSKYSDNTIKIIGIEACKDNNLITELDFSQTSITKIENMAFYNNVNIQKITLPSTIVTIEVNAFRYTNIREIKIPSLVETFNGAFSMCLNLNYINVEGNTRFISAPEGVYNNDYTTLIRAHGNVTYASITHIDTIKSFGKYAFSGTHLDRFTSTEKISEISEGLFERCEDLFELDLILSTATSIGSYCFKDCKSLKTVILPSEIQVISQQAFWACSISSVFIPSSVTEFGYDSFYGQSGLTRVYYFGLKNFEVDAFKDTTINPIIYVPLNYKYDTLFSKPVKKAKLNDMFIITNKCPNTNNCNNPFIRIAKKLSLLSTLILGMQQKKFKHL